MVVDLGLGCSHMNSKKSNLITVIYFYLLINQLKDQCIKEFFFFKWNIAQSLKSDKLHKLTPKCVNSKLNFFFWNVF